MTTYPQDRFLNVRLTPGSFWEQWRTVARTVTAPTQLAMLKSTGRYAAFDLQRQPVYDKPMDVWPVPNHLFWESDVAKFVEAACYLLQEEEDGVLRDAVNHLVDLIERAQQPDGYLNIHFVVCEPDKRWSSLRDLHELYNAGHLIEAAVAHLALTGSRQLVDVMLRFVRYTASVFGPDAEQKHGYPGHPEIELALLRLHRATGDQQCLALADYFVRQRGQGDGAYFRAEQQARGEHGQLAPAMMPRAHSYWYMQAHKPIAEQDTVEGHSVRAMYLLTAVADLCIVRDDGALHAACQRLWRDSCTRKTAVTGGIGTVHQWEGFGLPFALPNAQDEGGSYNETCASIGQLMVADRLQCLDGPDGVRYGDVAERALYNASLTTGMSIDGKAFTYDNGLASCDGHPCKRQTWFECACCPPNVLRSLAAVAGYFWSPTNDDGGVAIHHPFDGTLNATDGTPLVTIKTDYPWDGRMEVNVRKSDALLRIPGWAAKEATLNGNPIPSSTHKGYLSLGPGKHAVDLHIRPRLLFSHPYTNHDTLTVAYGPLIYCLEDVDNTFEHNHFKDLTLHADVQLHARRSDAHGGAIIIEAKQAGRTLLVGKDDDDDDASSSFLPEFDATVPLAKDKHDLVFVPYYYRANRTGGSGQMRTSIRQRHTEP